LTIPLTAVSVRSRKERRENFFKELLPKGRMPIRLAQQAALVEQDVIGLLRAYGREPAGAPRNTPEKASSLAITLPRALRAAALRAAPLPVAAIAAFAGTRGRRRRDTISLPSGA
jgi:hypothetical protein